MSPLAANILFVTIRTTDLPEKLRELGYEVQVASTGYSALSLSYRNFFPGVVISDIDLPDLSGPEMMRQIRFRFPNMPAIYLTDNLSRAVIKCGFDPNFIVLEEPCSTAFLDDLMHRSTSAVHKASLIAELPLTTRRDQSLENPSIA